MPMTTHRAMRNGMRRLFLFCFIIVGVDIYHFDVCLSEQLKSVFKAVFFSIYYSFDACLDDEF